MSEKLKARFEIETEDGRKYVATAEGEHERRDGVLTVRLGEHVGVSSKCSLPEASLKALQSVPGSWRSVNDGKPEAGLKLGDSPKITERINPPFVKQLVESDEFKNAVREIANEIYGPIKPEPDEVTADEKDVVLTDAEVDEIRQYITGIEVHDGPA